MTARLGILLLCTLFSAAIWLPSEPNDNWPQWRGPYRNGVSNEVGIPLHWNETENILWKTPIEGRGHSSPVIWEDRIFLTTDIEGEVLPDARPPRHIRDGQPYKHPATLSSDRRHTLKVVSLDADNGAILWRRTVHDGGVFDDRHRVNTYATPTAVTDGERVYTYFGSQGVFAFDFDGNLLWKEDFGNIATWGHGHGTSPLLFEDSLVFQIDQNEGDGSFLIALDKRTGKTIWRTARNERISYSSPILVGDGSEAIIITCSYENVIAYAARTGRELWRTPGFLGVGVPTPVAGTNLIYAVTGYPDKLVRAIPIPNRPGGPSGAPALESTSATTAGPAQRLNASETRIIEPLWEYNKGTGYTPSPLLYRDYLYLVSDKGLLTCLEAATGKVLYEGARIPVATFVRASPVAWDNKILLAGEEGDVFVIQAGVDHKILGQSSLGERIIASPALARGRLYLRTEEHLYAIGK